SACRIVLRGLVGAGGVLLPRQIIAAIPALGAIARPVAVLPWLGAARTMSVVQGSALIALAWGIMLGARDIHTLGGRGRGLALIAGFAFTAQALIFAPYARPFIYFQF
ncbi:MAG: MBOAT family protein, partial [Rhodospirillales bacterium]|nr:MBOAT family protein [Rhodospirillales bacterium]